VPAYLLWFTSTSIECVFEDVLGTRMIAGFPPLISSIQVCHRGGVADNTDSGDCFLRETACTVTC
jgi:hypothetical protein